jgi:single-strand DNA-binding protein
MSLNKAMLIGNVGKDPEVRHLESGAAVASFPLATSERYKDKNGEYQEQTEWHNIVCWRGLAETVEKYIFKGSQVYIEGKIRTRNWQDQSGQKRYTTEIIADSIQMLGKRQDQQGQGNNMANTHQEPHYNSVPQAQATAKPTDTIAEDNTDDLPF